MKGGMERQLSLFLERHDHSQFEITLAVLKKHIAYAIPDEVKFIDLQKRYKLDIKFYYRLIRLILKHDVINSKISGINEILMILCGILNKKELIVEVRNTGTKVLPHFKKMSVIYRVFKRRWLVVCNSKKAMNEVKQFIPEYVPVTYVGNGIDTKKFTRRKELLQKKGDQIIIGFVGSFKPAKNLEYLFKVIQKLKSKIAIDIVLEIIGNPLDQSYFNYLHSLVEDLGIASQIRWVGNVNDIENYYNRFDIFILPSHHEGTPNVLLEAMSCECFCLISDAAISDNFLGKDFVFNIQTEESLVEKILWFSSLTEGEKEAIGKKNRAYIVRNFSVEEMVRRYTEVLTHSFLS